MESVSCFFCIVWEFVLLWGGLDCVVEKCNCMVVDIVIGYQLIIFLSFLMWLFRIDIFVFSIEIYLL